MPNLIRKKSHTLMLTIDKIFIKFTFTTKIFICRFNITLSINEAYLTCLAKTVARFRTHHAAYPCARVKNEPLRQQMLLRQTNQKSKVFTTTK